MDQPYKFVDDNILGEYRLNQMSVKQLKEAYFKLADVLRTTRHYSKHLRFRIRWWRAILKRRKYMRARVFQRRQLNASYIRKAARAFYRKKYRTSLRCLKNRAGRDVRKRAKIRYNWLKTKIPPRVKAIKQRLQYQKWVQLKKSRKTIQRQLSRRTRHAIFKYKALDKENMFMGLIKKEKLPGIGRYAGVYALVMSRVAKILQVKHDDLCFMVWFGTFESFNIGSLCLMYPGISTRTVWLKVLKLRRMGYLQHIGKFRRRNNYTFTPLGREFYNRVIRYMKRFRKPYRGVRITKKMVRVHFKRPYRART